MKLYGSLIYRELRLTGRRFVWMLAAFVLLVLLMLIPLFLGGFSGVSGAADATQSATFLFTATVALTGGLMAGTNNGLQRADISAGWKRYAFVLPPSAGQQALSNLLVKLSCILLFGLLTVIYTLAFDVLTGSKMILHALNVYLGTVSAAMLVDTAYSYIVMLARDKKQLRILGIAAFFAAGLVLRVFGLFGRLLDREGEVIPEIVFDKLLGTLAFRKTTLWVLAAFVGVCALFLLTMWRSHKRREP